MVDLTKESQELFYSVPLCDLSDDFAGQNIKSGIQAGRTVTLVIMRAAPHLTGLEWQHPLLDFAGGPPKGTP